VKFKVMGKTKGRRGGCIDKRGRVGKKRGDAKAQLGKPNFLEHPKKNWEAMLGERRKDESGEILKKDVFLCG